MNKRYVLVAFSWLLIHTGFARVYNVPGDFASVGAAIAGAADGSTILVAPGTYRENIVVYNWSKNLYIKATEGPASTIISGDGSRGLLLIHNAPGGANPKNGVWDGFTFRDGVDPVAYHSPVSIVDASPCFINCVFENNRASVRGGAVLVYGETSRPGFINCTFRNNRSYATGGAALIDGEHIDVVFKDCLFENNSNRVPGGNNDAHGGALFFSKSSGQVINSVFRNNSASYAGGAIMALTWWDTTPDTVTVRGCRFEGNFGARITPSGALPPNEGGSIMAENNVTVIVSHSHFSNETAHAGGSLHSYRANLFVDHCVFENCRATGTNYVGYGGAIGVNINDAGDGDRRDAEIRIENTLIRNCVAPFGGGIGYTGDLANNKRGTVILSNLVVEGCSSIASNHNYGHAGGVSFALADVTADNVMILNNTADGAGGGVVLIQDARLTINNSVVGGNRASFDAGLHNPGGLPVIEHNTLWAYNGSPSAVSTSVLSALPFTLYDTAYLAYFVAPQAQSPSLLPGPGALPLRDGFYAGSLGVGTSPWPTTFELASASLPTVGKEVLPGYRGWPGAPFGGEAAVLPGVVEAENYDEGGEMIAYHDTTPANLGGAYRQDGVDISAAAGSGNGHHVGWILPGEWMEYTVVVTQACSLYVTIRYAGPVDSSCYIQVNNDVQPFRIDLPATGGYGEWRLAQSPVRTDFSPGVHSLRFIAGSGSYNFDRMAWTTSYSPPPDPGPVNPVDDNWLPTFTPVFTRPRR